MDNMIAAQADTTIILDALKREVAVAEDALRRQKDALTDRVTKARAVLAQKNSEAKKREWPSRSGSSSRRSLRASGGWPGA